jgi:cytochrome c-type biogenesis protein CcmH/NrfF
MRKLIRQKISSGLTNEEIKTELVKEFGEDILTSANQKISRFFLWCLPVLFVVIFGYFLGLLIINPTLSSSPHICKSD